MSRYRLEATADGRATDVRTRADWRLHATVSGSAWDGATLELVCETVGGAELVVLYRRRDGELEELYRAAPEG
jgi:hypothetical protein